jgi:hypothetical protein
VSHKDLRERADAAVREFHLVHVTTVGFAREIIRVGQIDARPCKVMDKDLVYAFAMRPAYKLRDSRVKTDLLDYFPFVFIISTKNLSTPYHVYPFDTGGALSGAFDDGASPAVHLEDYELDQTLKAVNDHIEWAFASPGDYYDGKLKPGFGQDIPDWDSVGKTYAKIAKLASAGHNQPDKRASAIELAYGERILLDDVKFVIVPSAFLEDSRGPNTEMLDKLQARGIAWKHYEWRAHRAPEDFHVEIDGLVREHLGLSKQL